MGCATSLVKYLLFLFNLAFVLGSIALIAIGVIFKLNIDDYTEAINNIDSHFSLAPTLMIIVGSVIFVIAFFGCCGAIRESTCMLTTYAIILLTIFILQVALGVYAFLQFKDSDQGIKDEIRGELEKQLPKYKSDNAIKEAFDSLQKGVKCCGVTGPGDWRQVFQGEEVPTSCCPEGQELHCSQSSGAIYSEGCASKLFDFVKDSIKIVGIVVIVIAAIELTGAIIALCLSSSIRNHERRGNYA